MPQSFTKKPRSANTRRKRRRVLVTGAAGNIGSYFAIHASKKYDLVLMVHGDEDAADIKTIRKHGNVVEGDIENLEQMKKLCRGVDTVLHLAANPSPSATWDSVISTNITGTYNTFVAAKAAKCRRVIYASSIHAVSGYPADYQVHTNDPVNPGDLYGVSKCFGEALGRYMAEQEGLSTICLRIGAFQPLSTARSEKGVGLLDAFVSQRDLQQLIEKCIDVEDLNFAIFHGLSDNRFKRLDITDARQLVGYAPIDDATQANPQLRKLKLSKKVGAHSLQDQGQKSGLRKELKRSR